MRTLIKLGAALVAGSIIAQGEDVVIQSFDRPGQLTFNEVSSMGGYRVEWAPAAAGPWTNSWDALALIPAVVGRDTVTCAVPMVYRVVAMATNPPAPADMVLIPAGSFVMGDTFGEGDGCEVPLHAVSVSAFYIGASEVTKAQWDRVFIWAVEHG